MPKIVELFNADGLRWCSGCQTHMAVELFHRGGSAPDGLQRHCRVCRRAIRREQYERHRERDIAAMRAWEREHPERARVNRRNAQRSFRLRKRLESGALTRRLLRETQQAAEVAQTRRLLRATPDLKPKALADATGWHPATARRRLLKARGLSTRLPSRLTPQGTREERAG